MHLDWRPTYGYFDTACDCTATKVKVPVYLPPIKVHYGTCANASFTNHAANRKSRVTTRGHYQVRRNVNKQRDQACKISLKQCNEIF